ncbi:helix-turn-helix domain-containing protein [Micromonospora sp. NPDC049230]|uniref:helix-turn-helix domain-containing protein n=1 Tax=Micromonospora sp. NPDC049230 TaxID=3155502 RepID=UPI0034102482
MSISEAAATVGVSVETVRRWIDKADKDGEPVAARERDEHGRAIPGTWRKPYRDAVEAWAQRREGGGSGAATG